MSDLQERRLAIVETRSNAAKQSGKRPTKQGKNRPSRSFVGAPRSLRADLLSWPPADRRLGLEGRLCQKRVLRQAQPHTERLLHTDCSSRFLLHPSGHPTGRRHTVTTGRGDQSTAGGKRGCEARPASLAAPVCGTRGRLGPTYTYPYGQGKALAHPYRFLCLQMANASWSTGSCGTRGLIIWH